MERKKLRVGISCYPTFGGSGVIATEIGIELARCGHQVHFICLDVPRRLREFTDNIFFHEVGVLDYPLFTHPPYDISLASKMVEIATYQRLDLIHVHYAVPHATSALLAAQVLGQDAPPVVTTLHGTDITLVGNDPAYLPITRYSIYQSSGVTAPSQYLKEATYEELHLSTSTPIEVIPNFVDVDLFRPAASAGSGNFAGEGRVCPRIAGERTITHVSNFRPVKRLEDVVRIFALVNEQVRSRLVLVGDGPERGRTQELVRELGLGERVCFLGKQDAFLHILQQSDLFLLPSATESFGLAALEAMSCGVPVIATDVGGIPEVVADGESGFLSPLGDVESMANNAIMLLRDEQLHAQFAKEARARAVSEFRLQDVVPQYVEYYYRLLG